MTLLVSSAHVKDNRIQQPCNALMHDQVLMFWKAGTYFDPGSCTVTCLYPSLT